jgi:hypothetical protein
MWVRRACRLAEGQEGHYASNATVYDELSSHIPAADLLSRGASTGEHILLPNLTGASTRHLAASGAGGSPPPAG